MLTIDIENDHPIVGGCQVCIARHTYQPCIQMLTSDVRIWQVVNRFAIRPVLECLVNHGIIQVPGDVWPWTTYK